MGRTGLALLPGVDVPPGADVGVAVLFALLHAAVVKFLSTLLGSVTCSTACLRQKKHTVTVPVLQAEPLTAVRALCPALVAQIAPGQCRRAVFAPAVGEVVPFRTERAGTERGAVQAVRGTVHTLGRHRVGEHPVLTGRLVGEEAALDTGRADQRVPRLALEANVMGPTRRTPNRTL